MTTQDIDKSILQMTKLSETTQPESGTTRVVAQLFLMPGSWQFTPVLSENKIPQNQIMK